MDSGNILSVLNFLAQGAPQGAAPTNVLQQAAPGNTDPSQGPYYSPPAPEAPQPQAPPPNVLQQAAPPAPPAPADIAQAAVAASPPAPKPRRSLLDTIGRISDVFAKVGGADALYQPTLDAREDRTLALGDHARQVDLDALKKTLTQQQVAAGALEPQVAERKRIGVALSAIAGQDNAAELWPSVAEQAGIDPVRAQAIGKLIAANPGSAGVLAKSLGADNTLGKNVYFGADANGKTVAYQVGPDGQPHVLDFGTTGITPSEPIKVVDTGTGQVIVGQGGSVKKILPKFEAPGKAADRKERAREADNTNVTTITVAGMPARAKDGSGAGGKGKGSPKDALAYLDNIDAGFEALHAMKALPGDGTGLGAVESAIGRTGVGQKVGEQLGSAAAQKRLELIKNINSLQSEMIQSLPGSATRTKFEQEIQKARLPDPMKMSYSTAKNVLRELREQYQRALTDLAKEKPAAKVQPTGGWGTATVVHGG
jgi:hypothetical protein